IERARKVGAYVGISVFLDDERGRSMPHEHEQRAVLRAGLFDELHRLARDLGEGLAAGLDHECRSRNGLGRGAGDGRHWITKSRRGDRQVLSFCSVVIISTRRRQIFSMKFMTLLRSASSGNCRRGSSGLAAGGSGLTVPGSGRLRASSSFLTATFSP